MKRINELGKTLRKIRVEQGINQHEMAKKIGITTSYLSNIESSSKPATSKILNKIRAVYDLRGLNNEKFSTEMNLANKMTYLDLRGLTEDLRKLALNFALNFASLNQDEIKKVNKILNKAATCLNQQKVHSK